MNSGWTRLLSTCALLSVVGCEPVDDTSGGAACANLMDKACNPDDPSAVFYLDSCGGFREVFKSCQTGEECYQSPAGGNPTCEEPGVCDEHTASTICVYPSGLRTLYEESYVASAGNLTCSHEGELAGAGEALEHCGFGSACFQDSAYNEGEALCHRSIDASQADKPYYDFGCSRFSMWMRHPTKLEMDCRCRIVGDGQGGAGGTGDALADPNNIDITNGGRPGGPIINCGTQDAMAKNTWPVQYGTGPSFNAWYQQSSSGASWFSGTVDPATREMYAIIKWSSPQASKAGAVVAWNLDTKNRRVVTGLHPEAGEFGSGYKTPFTGPFPFGPQILGGANVVQIGPDNMLYVFGGGTGEGSSDTREIVRVHPVTGERTLAWLAENTDSPDLSDTYGQCYRPDQHGHTQTVALQANAFEIGPDGTFYMSMHGIREGDGIVSVSADGKTCKVHSRWGGTGHVSDPTRPAAPAPDPIGNGPYLQFPVKGLLFHDGKIYGVSNDELYSFDLTTGDIAHVSYTHGTYGGMGYANMFWDPSREVVWAVGTVAKYVGSIVNLKNGRRESIYGDTGRDEHGDQAILVSDYPESRSVSSPSTTLTNGNSIGYGGVVLDPDNNDIVYAVLKSGGLLKMELSTFNNYVVSW